MSENKYPLKIREIPGKPGYFLIPEFRISCDKPPIVVWRFEDAPEDLRGLVENDGDEDWLAVVPAYFIEDGGIPWIDCCSGFDSLCEPEKHQLASGDVVYIGTHA